MKTKYLVFRVTILSVCPSGILINKKGQSLGACIRSDTFKKSEGQTGSSVAAHCSLQLQKQLHMVPGMKLTLSFSFSDWQSQTGNFQNYILNLKLEASHQVVQSLLAAERREKHSSGSWVQHQLASQKVENSSEAEKKQHANSCSVRQNK